MRLRTLLFKNKNFQTVGKVMRDLWKLRKTPLKHINSQDFHTFAAENLPSDSQG